jgi:hypothetical protein
VWHGRSSDSCYDRLLKKAPENPEAREGKRK